jgi:hypothetical protein
MDWGLGVAEFGYLREKLLFKRRSIYLVVCVCLCPRVLLIPLFRFNGSLRAQAIFTDLCLRFCWTFSLIPAAALPNYLAKYMDFWMVAFLEFAELFRRAMWGCFRSVLAFVRWFRVFRTLQALCLFTCVCFGFC